MVGAGAEVDKRGYQDITVLVAAARQGHTATVQKLDAGVNAMLMNKDGDTALLRAVKNSMWKSSNYWSRMTLPISIKAICKTGMPLRPNGL